LNSANRKAKASNSLTKEDLISIFLCPIICFLDIQTATSNLNNVSKNNKMKTHINHIERNDRWDIYNNLPRGSIIKLSKQCNCSEPQVHGVLHGNKTDRQGIIKAAELLAAVNIWKTRFCKLDKSQL
jgi:hypothetical protein